MTNPLALTAGAELIGEFRIERVLGAGGFGMTYLAEEIALQRRVTIKEYLPSDFALRGDGQTVSPRDAECGPDFQWGLDRFIDEAQTLARFDHPHIVKVHRYFKANGTAYLVLSFEEGQSLKGWLKGLQRAPRQREIDDLLGPLLDALETIHAADYLHRDIAPDNIIVRLDGTPVLIDFGSARGEIAARTRTVSALVKPGYSPYEQYAETGARQGPWTDIYALGATLYHAISGKRPADAPSRVVRDELVPAKQAALATYRSRFLEAIERALMLDPAGRPQSIAAWRGELLAPDPAKPGWFSRRHRKPEPVVAAAAGNAKTVLLTRQPGVLPPPPDAPGAPGGMLDFFEGLQKQPAAAPPPIPMAAAPAVEHSGGRARSGASGAAKAASPSAGKIAPSDKRKPGNALVPAPPKAIAARPRPRPRPEPGDGARRWRSFAAKFMVGAGIAGAALAYNEGFLSAPPGRPETPVAHASKSRDVPVARVTTSSTSTRAGTAASFGTAPAPSAETPPSAATPAARATIITGHAGGATAVGFTGDGRSVVTAGADGTLKIWNAETGASQRTITLEAGPARSAAVDGTRAVTGHADGRIAVWDLAKGQRIASFKHGSGPIEAVAFLSQGERIAAGASDGAIAVWDIERAGEAAALLEAHDGAITALASDGRGLLVSGGEDRSVRLWRSGKLDPVRSYRGHREAVTAVALSANGRHLAAAAADGRVRVWSTTSAGVYRLTAAHKSTVSGLAFSPSGEILASTGEDGSLHLWYLRRGRALKAAAEPGAAGARALAFAPDGERAAVAGADGKIRFWEAGAGARRR